MDLTTSEKITWCPGCGNHSIIAAIKQAIIQSGQPQESFVFVFGIGCHGHMVNYLRVYGFEGLHGRPIPVAEGIKLANSKLNVIVVTGDGDTYGEGLSHFIHACRRNININLFIHDNRVFGLTTGQTSPTADIGYISKSTPDGSIEQPVANLALAISSGASFVAQEGAFDIHNLKETMAAAIKHPGLSYLNILQQCATFNKINTNTWFQSNSARISQKISQKDRSLALLSVIEAKKLPLGVIYKEEKPTYESQVVFEKKLMSFEELKKLY